MIKIGTVITYDGTPYTVRQVTPNAFMVGENYQQLIPITRKEILAAGFKIKVGRSPAWVHL